MISQTLWMKPPAGVQFLSNRSAGVWDAWKRSEEMSHFYSTFRDKEKVFKGYLVTLWCLKLMDVSVKSEAWKSE